MLWIRDGRDYGVMKFRGARSNQFSLFRTPKFRGGGLWHPNIPAIYSVAKITIVVGMHIKNDLDRIFFFMNFNRLIFPILELQDELMKLTSEYETRTLSANELEKEIEEMQKVCESLKSEIKKQDEQKADLEKKAKDNYLGLEHEVSIIGKQNKTLYLITRLTWDDKAMKKDLNLIKGFVFNKTNNDVSVFETDPKKTNNKTIVSDLLWDYIGAGISQEWKKGKDWKM